MKLLDTQAEVDEVLSEASSEARVAIDTEADSLHSYFDKVCLIQISTSKRDAVIDPLARVSLESFGRLLVDSSIEKVLHGADYDLRILNRDFGFTIAPLFDTMVASQLLGYDAVGLAALLKRHFNVDVDKSHQRADWAQRPLPRVMLQYATLDTKHLLELSTILRAELETLGRWEWAVEEFERLSQIRYREPEQDPEAFRKLKGISSLAPRHLAVLQRLFQWRDERARKRDVPPFRVLRNEPMIAISSAMPRDLESLKKTKGVDQRMIDRAGDEILRRIDEAARLSESELPQRAEAKKWIRDKDLEKRVEALKTARDAVVKEIKIDASILAPKHILTAVAQRKPRSSSDFDEVTSLRRWQRSLLEQPFLEVLSRWP